MKILHISYRSMRPDNEGRWRIYGKLLVGNTPCYGVVLYSHWHEALSARNGDPVPKGLCRIHLYRKAGSQSKT